MLESLIEEAHDSKVEVQKERIEKGDDPTKVRPWSRDWKREYLCLKVLSVKRNSRARN